MWSIRKNNKITHVDVDKKSNYYHNSRNEPIGYSIWKINFNLQTRSEENPYINSKSIQIDIIIAITKIYESS